MYKVMILIKRRPGMSMKEFIDYYESHHAVLGASTLPMMTSYVRHYLSPVGSHVRDADEELPYDIVTEITFEDERGFQEAMATLAVPETAAKIIADEERLFDRSTITFMQVEDRATDMTRYARR
jgi:hypothetical protein